MRRISVVPIEDTQELFKRLCFNALISNVDDHPRNHAFIAQEKNWRLSPAYDLTPTQLMSLERRDLAMVCGDKGRFANAQNILSQSGRFLLKEDQAKKIVDEMEVNVRQNWYSTMRSVGVSEQDCDTLKSAFVYPGFSFEL